MLVLTKEFVATIKAHSAKQYRQMLDMRGIKAKDAEAREAAFCDGMDTFQAHLLNAGLAEIQEEADSDKG